MDVAHSILFAKKIDISRGAADYSSAKFELITKDSLSRYKKPQNDSSTYNEFNQMDITEVPASKKVPYSLCGRS